MKKLKSQELIPFLPGGRTQQKARVFRVILLFYFILEIWSLYRAESRPGTHQTGQISWNSWSSSCLRSRFTGQLALWVACSEFQTTSDFSSVNLKSPVASSAFGLRADSSPVASNSTVPCSFVVFLSRTRSSWRTWGLWSSCVNSPTIWKKE